MIPFPDRLINELGIVDEQLVIHEHFNNPFRIREEGLLDKVLRTLSTEPIQGADYLVTSEVIQPFQLYVLLMFMLLMSIPFSYGLQVTQRLFQPRHQHFGMDLIALNIQRGRDHGIPGYNHYRQECKIGRVETFQGFTDWISPHVSPILSNCKLVGSLSR
jgi:peroxidase